VVQSGSGRATWTRGYELVVARLICQEPLRHLSQERGQLRFLIGGPSLQQVIQLVSLGGDQTAIGFLSGRSKCEQVRRFGTAHSGSIWICPANMTVGVRKALVNSKRTIETGEVSNREKIGYVLWFHPYWW
jgi:hypothetical protein